MAHQLRIVLAQINPKVGDIQGNLKLHIEKAIHARDELKADIIVFPELSLTGYPPEDLLLRPAFIREAELALQTLATDVTGIHCFVGLPHFSINGLVNACALIHDGKVLGRYAKQHLPNYGVFDERRYFIPETVPCVINIKNIPVGLVICEDLWLSGPVQQAVQHGARVILSPNASPFETDKHERRVNMLSQRAKTNKVPIVYVNCFGGQDEIVFDGGSMVVNAQGELVQYAEPFREAMLAVQMTFTDHVEIAQQKITVPSTLKRIYDALVLGLRDYIHKNNFSGVLLGLSGGIDSALTLAIAVDALGKDKVHAIYMPSRFSADISFEDAKVTAENLGTSFAVISIETIHQSFLTTLTPAFRETHQDITEENIQARARAVILMALSNKFGHLVLTTGNRSELAVGYCTLYGDMAGGFAVLKDIPKTLVYELANYRNKIKHVIPERTITRAPTAELAPNQKDEDTLPAYAILDQILERYLNLSQSSDEIIAAGFDESTVLKVIGLIRKNEYKRKQSAIGARINHKSFGKDWRYPVTNGFKG